MSGAGHPMGRSTGNPADPHAGQPIASRGRLLSEAAGAVIMVHGRGASPENILPLAEVLGEDRLAFLAPAAAGHTWYPWSFMEDTARNEPGLSSALGVLDSLVAWVEAQGIPAERVALLGFSQGACLATEYAVRHARRLGAVVAFSGGLIGPPGTVWEYPGSFDGTPVFLGGSDVDPHIPLARVTETEAVFRRMGAEVTQRIYPGMGHLVNEDEAGFARTLLEDMTR